MKSGIRRGAADPKRPRGQEALRREKKTKKALSEIKCFFGFVFKLWENSKFFKSHPYFAKNAINGLLIRARIEWISCYLFQTTKSTQNLCGNVFQDL